MIFTGVYSNYPKPHDRWPMKVPLVITTLPGLNSAQYQRLLSPSMTTVSGFAVSIMALSPLDLTSSKQWKLVLWWFKPRSVWRTYLVRSPGFMELTSKSIVPVDCSSCQHSPSWPWITLASQLTFLKVFTSSMDSQSEWKYIVLI